MYCKTAKFGNSNGVYASLSPSDEGIRAIEKGAPIMLPAVLVESSQDASSSVSFLCLQSLSRFPLTRGAS